MCCCTVSCSPCVSSTALMPPCAHTELERITSKSEKSRARCPPAAMASVAQSPLTPPPTTMTRLPKAPALMRRLRRGCGQIADEPVAADGAEQQPMPAQSQPKGRCASVLVVRPQLMAAVATLQPVQPVAEVPVAPRLRTAVTKDQDAIERREPQRQGNQTRLDEGQVVEPDHLLVEVLGARQA
jgi:hypothetical protein